MKDPFAEKQGLTPVYSPQCEILILGSFPSVLSRGNFYYGNPRNRFWRMMEEVFRAPVPPDKQGRAEFLLAHKIALWDVVGRCLISGSGDADIKAATIVQINDIPALTAGGNIKKILCNGGKSFALFNKYFGKSGMPAAVQMPSTSPANFKFSLDEWKNQLV